MKDLLKYGLIGVGGYLLLRNFGVIGASSTTTPATPTTPTPATTTPAATPPAPAAPAPAPTPPAATPPAPAAPTSAQNALRQALLAASGNASKLNTDQWNYFYALIPGKTQTTIDLFGTPYGYADEPRTNQITVDDYLSRRAAAGLSGVIMRGATRANYVRTGRTTAPARNYVRTA